MVSPVTRPNPLPVRSPLDLLRLDCPGHQISMRAVGDKLFYLAESTKSGVQPRFAQAVTVDRLRAKLQAPVKEFSVAEPSIPRVWDFLLGGKDNFAADREQATKLLAVFPRAAELARESREFQRRAVAHVARAGVWQFLDLGCGLPTSPATHEVAREAQPGATVAYVDNDELVMSHARSLLARSPGILAVAGDLTHPDEILYDWRIRQAIDFRQPIAVVLTMSLHFFDSGTARAITSQLAAGNLLNAVGLPIAADVGLVPYTLLVGGQTANDQEQDEEEEQLGDASDAAKQGREVEVHPADDEEERDEGAKRNRRQL